MDYIKLFDYYGNIPPMSTKNRSASYKLLHSSRRYIIRKLAVDILLPYYYRKYRKITSNVAENTIISLTSFPKRLSTLWIVIESLKHQELIPEKIVLYLSEEEVGNKNNIPQSLLAEEDSIFEIRLRSGKLRAHGKYHFAMKDFPDKNIVTVDDDMIYPPNMLKTLIGGHLKFPNYVITNCTAQVLLDEKNDVKTYNEWKRSFSDTDYIGEYCELDNMIPMGVCGVLYPPHILYEDTLNFDIARQLSFLADDLWLYSQIKLSGSKVIKTNFNTLSCIPIEIEDNATLTSVNVGEHQNDIQFNQLRDYYIQKTNIDIVR